MATQVPQTKKAGLFDLRWILTVLFGIYGIILTVLGIGFTTQADLDKAGGVNINLWAGLAMVVVAILFGIWAAVRPVVLPVSGPEPE